MKMGVAVSAVAHAALLAWGLFAVQASVPDKLPDIETLPVELVTEADITDLAKGKPTAEPEKQASVADPAPVVAPDPTPAPEPEKTPPPVETPPPPPPVAEAPPPPPEPPPPVVAETPPPPPPPPPEPAPAKVEPAPPPPPPVVADKPPPKPDPAPKPAPPKPDPAVKTAAAPVPKPKPKTPPVTTEKKSDFDPDRIEALIDKSAKAAPPPSEKKAALGTSTGKPDAKMTETALDALRQKITSCLADWTPPIGWTDPSEVRTVVKFNLQQDGTVTGAPEVLERPAGQYSLQAPEAAIRRIFICSPFKLPPESYSVWREATVTFDPVAMAH